MKPKLLIRIAMGCVLFFAVGHSIGHFNRKNITDPNQKAVVKMMESFKFPLGPQMRSYDELLEGMSANLSIALLMIAALLWVVSGIASSEPKTSAKILWPVFLCLVAFTATGFLYFFIVPAITCAVASALIIVSINLLGKTNK
jgi:hypothetical protein